MRNTIKGVALVCAAALIGLLALLAQGSGGAGAATYPPTTCATLSVSTMTPQQGETITVTGSQFQPNESVKLYLTPKSDYPGATSAVAAAAPASSSILLATVTTDANGAFSASVTMPTNVTGNQILSADGAGKICPADPIQIQVNGSGAPSGGSSGATSSSNGGTLGNTGVDIAVLVAVAAVLVGAGTLFLRGGRRRHAGARH